MRCALAILALLAFGTPAVRAQEVRGSVLAPGGDTAPAGVIVIATREGAPAVRTLTDARGSFTLPLPSPGAWELRALRIGFTPSALVRADVAAGVTATVTLVLSGQSVVLSRITVRGRDECRVHPDSGLAVARVWQEARKALLSAELASTAPLDVSWQTFDRVLDPASGRVREQVVEARAERTARAFRSAPPQQLEAQGFVISDSATTEFFAPDAGVLLSDGFAARYCLLLREAPGDPSTIGVGFRPQRPRDGVREIEGTFWLDRTSAELRSLDYRYLGLPQWTDRAEPGGRVEYARLASGHWLVNAWTIRMPEGSMLGPARTNDPGRRVLRRAGPTLTSVRLAGGFIAEVRDADSLLFTARRASLVVTVEARPGEGAAERAGTRLQLTGTNLVAQTDTTGTARFTALLGGRYTLLVRTAGMVALGVPPIERVVLVREGMEERHMVPAPDERGIVRAVCGDAMRAGEGVLYGVARDPFGRPVGGVAVSATWIGALRGGAGAVLATERNSRGTFADDAGRWRLCGVPQQRPLRLVVTGDSATGIGYVELDEGSLAMEVPLEVERRTSAAGGERSANAPANAPANATVDSTPGGAATAILEVRLRTSDGRPVRDARLSLARPDARPLEARTDTEGRALFPAIVPGRVVLEVRSLGHNQGRFSIAVEAGRNTLPIVLDRIALPSLDTVRVIGGVTRPARLDAFESRRLRGDATSVITGDDIAKRAPTSTEQMLRGLASLRVVDGPQGIGLVSTRVTVKSLIAPGAQYCFMRVAVDGRLLPGDPPDLSQLPAPEEVHGIEVFAGAARIPLEFGGAGKEKWCGLVAIWTKG